MFIWNGRKSWRLLGLYRHVDKGRVRLKPVDYASLSLAKVFKRCIATSAFYSRNVILFRDIFWFCCVMKLKHLSTFFHNDLNPTLVCTFNIILWKRTTFPFIFFTVLVIIREKFTVLYHISTNVLCVINTPGIFVGNIPWSSFSKEKLLLGIFLANIIVSHTFGAWIVLPSLMEHDTLPRPGVCFWWSEDLWFRPTQMDRKRN